MAAPVRVLVVAGSPLRQQHLRSLVDAAPPLQCVGTATGPGEAVDAAARGRADVIVLDQGSPRFALACTREVMQARAMPVVVVTAAGAPCGAQSGFDLMEAGALAIVADPGPVSGAAQRQAHAEWHKTIRLMSEVKVVRRWAPRTAAAQPAPPASRRPAPAVRRPAPGARSGLRSGYVASRRVDLVAIGASTGGPVALKQLLECLPVGFPAPILVVQHMAAGFLQGLADWLSQSCALPAQVGAPGTELQPGRIYLAPDGVHMVVDAALRLAFDAGPPVNGHRPAVSRLLGSVAAHCAGRAAGILLTGMGKDGAAELKQMREAGAITFAQDAASSVVHGMPGEAIRCGGAGYVMTPAEIGAALAALQGVKT